MRERDTCVLKRKTSAFDTFPSDRLHVNLSTDAKLQRCFPLKTTRRVKYKKTPKDEAAKAKRIPHSVLLWGTGGIFLCVFFFFGRSFYLLSRKFTNKDIGHENTPEDFEHPVWLCEESSHIHMADFFLFPDKRERQAACVLITAVKHFKPQDHTQICIDLIPKNKAPLKSPWLPSEPVQQSSGRPRFESKSLARAWDNVCWLSEMTRPIFPRRPPPHDVEKPLVTAETGL